MQTYISQAQGCILGEDFHEKIPIRCKKTR